ncbi:MAG TPA: hypothetical protein PKH77_27035, partial [Anaerolineae bacterium]|nr:hypothetical protein [Anaerolineae bacterium]
MICENGKPVGSDLAAYDEFSGLRDVTVACSPARTFNLSWTDPGRFYAGTTRLHPELGATCQLTLTNQAGFSAYQTLYGDCGGGGGGGGGGSGPGGDHPDDNASAASAPILDAFFALPAGARSVPQVAILNRGFAHELWRWLLDMGEPATLIGLDFAPAATAAHYPVLLIPTGGLFGLENDTAFRARLAEYTRLGGALVTFAQQHGYEYYALPGGELDGYGWDEDISCFKAALTMETWHPALSSFRRDTLTVHVDGYFTRWPDEAQVLLSRTANGQPGVLTYSFGAGRVIATTLYDDWGVSLGQSAPDAQTLLRDLLTWAITPANLPQYAPGTAAVLTLPITNTTATESNGVTLRLIDPARQVVLTTTLTLTLPAGAAASIPVTFTAATPRGLWRVDAQLWTLAQYPLTGFRQVARYAVAQPPALVDPATPLYLSITAPATEYVEGSVAPFTYHLYNRGSTPLTATVSYGLNHQHLADYTRLAADVVVPAAQGDVPGTATLTQTLRVAHYFRLRGYATAGEWQAQAAFGVWSIPPAVRVFIQNGLAVRGAPVTVHLSVNNLSAAPVTTTLFLTAVDGARHVYHTATLTAALAALPPGMPWAQPTVLSHTFNVPPSITGGSGQIWVEARDAAQAVIGGGVAQWHTPESPLAFSLLPAPSLTGGGPATFTVAITNTSSSQTVAHGALTVTLKTPVAGVTAATTVPFTLAPGATRLLTAPLDLPLLTWGRYSLTLALRDEYGARLHQVFWNTLPDVTGAPDRPAYHARETVTVTVTLAPARPGTPPLGALLNPAASAVTHPGPFVPPQSVTLHAASLAFSATQTWDAAAPDRTL